MKKTFSIFMALLVLALACMMPVSAAEGEYYVKVSSDKFGFIDDATTQDLGGNGTHISIVDGYGVGNSSLNDTVVISADFGANGADTIGLLFGYGLDNGSVTTLDVAVDSKTNVVGTFSIPYTGGWEIVHAKWFYADAKIPAGEHRIFITFTSANSGSFSEVVFAEAAPHADYLQQLPANVCGRTNLWEKVEQSDKYYTGSAWGSLGNLKSITIPVKEGDRIYANSFGAAPDNGYTTNGIRITYFTDDAVLQSVKPADVYNEFKDAGYLTVPAGATAMNIPVWDATKPCEVYLVSAGEHAYVNGICSACGAAEAVGTSAPTQTPETADVSMIVVAAAALALTAVVVLRRRVRG